jgi:hypothetical protein
MEPVILFQAWNYVNRLIKYSGNIDVYVVGSDQVKTIVPEVFCCHLSLVYNI